MNRSRPPLDLQALRPLARESFHWDAWTRCIEARGIAIDRLRGTPHPDFPSIRYPLDYGSVNDTLATDGEPIDVFVGTGTTGLVGAILTTDHRQQDREAKLLYDCTPPNVYAAHGFINFDRTLLDGVLVLRRPMPKLWDAVG